MSEGSVFFSLAQVRGELMTTSWESCQLGRPGDLCQSHPLLVCCRRKAGTGSLVWVTSCVAWDKSPSFIRLSVLFHEIWVPTALTSTNLYEDKDKRTQSTGLCKWHASLMSARRYLLSVHLFHSCVVFWVRECRLITRPLRLWASSASQAQVQAHRGTRCMVPNRGAEVNQLRVLRSLPGWEVITDGLYLSASFSIK